jgi:hypothetical protein
MTNHRGDLRGTGDGLTEDSIRWGKRPDVAPVIGITPRDLDLFAWLEQHRFATTGILTTLFWRSYGSPVRERLRGLHDAGYLDKFRPAVYGRGGSAEWIYRLTPRGWETLCDMGRSATGRLPFGELTDLAYAAHDLQLDALLLHAADLAYPGDRPLIDRLPFDWQGPDLGRIDRDGGDAPARRSPAAILPEGVTTRRGTSLPGILEPDATLLGRHRDSGRPLAVLIEYDRTTRATKQRDRFRRYDRFLAETWREGRFADHHSAPIALYLLQAESHMATFLKEADKHLSAWEGHRTDGPAQGAYPGRDLLFFSTRERIAAGEWTMDRVPSQPPEVRGSTTLHTRTMLAPVLSLFAVEDDVAERAA